MDFGGPEGMKNQKKKIRKSFSSYLRESRIFGMRFDNAFIKTKSK